MRSLFLVMGLILPASVTAQNIRKVNYLSQDPQVFLAYEVLNRPLDFSSIDYELLNAAIFHLTNLERLQAGKKPLIPSQEAMEAATGHAEDMVKHNFYSHTSPIRFRRTVRDRLNRSGLNPPYLGENILSTHGIQYQEGKKVKKPTRPGEFRYMTASQVDPIPPHTYRSLAEAMVRLWMNSPGHRQNILNPVFTHMGCGTKIYFDQNFYGMPYFMAVQNFFGRQGSPSP